MLGFGGHPSAEGPLPSPDQLIGRPRALAVDLLGELHGPLFYADFNGGFRKLYACSLELVAQLCDESRFAKNLTATLGPAPARLRSFLGDRAVLMSSTPSAYPHVVSRLFAYFRVVRISISAGRRDFCSGFDSRQLHNRVSLEPILMSF